MFRLNQLPVRGERLDPEDARYLDTNAARRVQALLDLCPAARPTALRPLPGLAHRYGIGQVFVKDESTRLGLGSFKALGDPRPAAR